MITHVETVCLLSKLHEAKHHINVKVDMDELDLTSAEAKATYKEIEEWVQEHYGFHVTNLNIAQVKQKHGIIERENYNKPKSENSRQPGCPEEKIQTIGLLIYMNLGMTFLKNVKLIRFLKVFGRNLFAMDNQRTICRILIQEFGLNGYHL